jgi:glucose/mannose transport system substrate-binding protein
MGTDSQIYENFVNGTATEEEIQQVLTVYKTFLGFVTPDHTARLWYEAAGSLYNGDVAMVLQGGWIKAYFNSRGWVYGEDYGAFEAPGTDGMFGLAVDAFVVPQGSASPENGVRWAHMCSDTTLQETFSPLKGSISPYRDTSTDIYDEITIEFLNELLADGTLVYPSFTHGISLPWSVLQDLHSRITDFTTSSNPDVERHARLIVQSLREAGIEPRWDFVD